MRRRCRHIHREGLRDCSESFSTQTACDRRVRRRGCCDELPGLHDSAQKRFARKNARRTRGGVISTSLSNQARLYAVRTGFGTMTFHKFDWIFVLAVGLIVLSVSLLPTPRDHNPPIPATAEHRSLTSEKLCGSCHVANGTRPLSGRHPKRLDCFRCHRWAEIGNQPLSLGSFGSQSAESPEFLKRLVIHQNVSGYSFMIHTAIPSIIAIA